MPNDIREVLEGCAYYEGFSAVQGNEINRRDLYDLMAFEESVSLPHAP